VLTLPFLIDDRFGIDIVGNIFFIFLVLAYILLGLVVFFDFITLGSIKKIKDNFISKIYFPIYWFFSTVTLSFLYRPLIYNFIDDKYTRKLFFMSIPYVVFVVFGDRIFTNNPNPHIPSNSSLMNQGLSINHNYYDELNSEHMANNSSGFLSETKLWLFTFKIDDIDYKDSLNCYFSSRANYGESGLLCNLSTVALSEGNHIIEFERRDPEQDNTRYKKLFIPILKMSK